MWSEQFSVPCSTVHGPATSGAVSESPAPLAMRAMAMAPLMYLLPWGIGKVQSGSGERCSMTGDDLQKKLQFPLSVQQDC